MKSIYILLTRTNTCVSRAIHLLTADSYTHASISFEAGLQPLYSFSRKFTYIPLPAGLQCEPFETGLFKKNRDIPCALYELRVSDEVFAEAKGVVEAMMAAADSYRFNTLGLILCGVNIAFPRKRRYFCSEFVGVVLQSSRAHSLPKKPSLMRPADYTRLPGASCLYRGTLKALTDSRVCATPA